jgi:hypothetical protein
LMIVKRRHLCQSFNTIRNKAPMEATRHSKEDFVDFYEPNLNSSFFSTAMKLETIF